MLNEYSIDQMWTQNQKPLILVVDDSKEIRETLMDFFELEGINTICAVNGREAFEYLNSDLMIAAVVTDYMMPEVDGLSLRNLIRTSTKHFSNLPIILVSGASDELLNQWPSSDPYFRKPVNFDSLMQTLFTLLA